MYRQLCASAVADGFDLPGLQIVITGAGMDRTRCSAAGAAHSITNAPRVAGLRALHAKLDLESRVTRNYARAEPGCE